MNEACCFACYLGEELASFTPNCSKENLPSFTGSTLDLIMECCLQKKRDLERHSGLYFKDTLEGCLLEDINECEIPNNGCNESQDCVNTAGSYACIPRGVCRYGFQFNREMLSCEIKNDFSELESKIEIISFDDFTETVPEEMRLTTTFSNQSLCLSGFSWNVTNKSCEDIDECHSETRLCEHYCKNIHGSFECSCKEGYEINPIDSATCNDIDECDDIKKNLCSHNCINTPGCYDCKCPDDYKLFYDGRTCMKIGKCPKGFRLRHDGTTCKDVNECLVKRDVCGAKICNNFIGGYECHEPMCPKGYRVHNRRNTNGINNNFK